MFSYCTDLSALQGLGWLSCYLTTGNHMLFYASFATVLLILAIVAPVALLFGFLGAMASRSRIAGVRWIGRIYTSMVRGVPDIIFFLFRAHRTGPGIRMDALARALRPLGAGAAGQ